MRIKKFLPIAILLIFTGCGIWTDFTTFFNLYFNTRELYYQVDEEISKLPKDPFQLKEPEITGTIKTNLIKIQEKASKILQHEAESSYFDNALFISGWAFYYNGDYIKANRKFQELASLGTDEYDLISRLWIGKCELQMRNFEKGLKIVEEVRDSALVREDEEVLNDAYKIIISYHIDREQFETAISEGEKYIEISEDDKFSALVLYQIGLLHLKFNNQEEAASAFASVLDYSPDFETAFNSQFELAKLKRELGQIDESRDMLNSLYNEGKYSSFWGDVYYEIGMIEYSAENYERAFNIFTDVNSLYASSKGAIKANLMLGEIMRNVYADYDSAKVYYDKVKGNNVDQELKETAEIYSQSITSYIKFKSDIQQSSRQITYILEPQEFFRDSLAYNRFLVQSGAVKNDQKIDQPFGTDTTNTNITTPTDTAAISDTTSTLAAADSVISTTPIFSVDDFDDDYILEIKPIFPTVGIDSLESKIAKDYFALGNLFFSDLMRPDSAYYYYDLLLKDYPETKYKPRVMFALATYFETKGNKEQSDSLYLEVYNEYKTHPLANESAKKLNKPLLFTDSDPAQTKYLIAESQIEEGELDSALVILKNISHEHPESIFKPKSLYTIGWIYENKINQPDSAAVYYSVLVDEYRNSDYAKAVNPKVNNYKAEQQRIENEKKKAEEDAKQQELDPQPETQKEILDEDTQVINEQIINSPVNLEEPTDTTQTKND
ncbi:MAG: tetratricopeptide repeat protein [Melioribacteraceae bacterium]|nr:tetratricopeptide repeat protein [Melioribacteraceae bacterium]WKZ70388.1 MAG: tetratricopeptide repeat protein [Melioribacteraceae bacterium]